ncbi:hypothetical protein PHYPSEUDO_005161 [Phytophthora pseudosyringae]|uniref:M96 mating-specific protein family n=1 Tax=Phytophthora pseudosyringae TaxID=221518 RepID=A0A8T1VMN2_9STRA|nr:hypothetical protein PHYPSEUDO_005161 [Phytophthora pseudosyringae]
MTTSDAAFLAEVDDFLTACALPTPPPSFLLPRDSDGSGNVSPKTNANFEKTSERVAKLASTRRLQTFYREEAEVKRELAQAKDRKRRKTYRERRRVERESLQHEVATLTEQLKKTHNVFVAAWKMLADRQVAARMAAEAEQSRLVKAIADRAALLKKFQELMSQRVAALDHFPARGDIDTGTRRCQHKRVRLEPIHTDDAVFAACINELDEVYAQTDKTLRSRGLDATEPNWDVPSESWIKDPDTGYFLHGGKLTLPFDFRAICRSRWYTAPLYHRQESRQLYKRVDDPENTVALKFCITTRLASGNIASVLQRIVIRRYEENERMVIVWRLFTEGEGAFNGMNASETGWTVAVPATNSAKTGTVMVNFVRNVPMHLSSVAKRQPTVKQFAGKLVEWGSENNLQVTKTLQNLLLKGE